MPGIRITLDPYQSAAEIAGACSQVLLGRWRAGHAGPIPKPERVRMTQAEVAERLGLTQSAVSRALSEEHGGTRYHAIRVRILREIGGFEVAEEPRWRVTRPEERRGKPAADAAPDERGR